MSRMSAEVRNDSALLIDVIALLETKTPLAAWPAEAVTALAEAVAPETGDPRERSKGARLERHLFAGPPPNALSEGTGTPSRRSDRLRADLADLTPCGAGLYLVIETP